MSSIIFPRTMVENVSCSRMIIGTNWLAGYSHTSPNTKQDAFGKK